MSKQKVSSTIFHLQPGLPFLYAFHTVESDADCPKKKRQFIFVLSAGTDVATDVATGDCYT